MSDEQTVSDTHESNPLGEYALMAFFASCNLVSRDGNIDSDPSKSIFVTFLKFLVYWESLGAAQKVEILNALSEYIFAVGGSDEIR